LPVDIEQRLLQLVHSWGLRFAACDFVHSLNDELIFLEANVVGNWLWTEMEGSDIAKEIAIQLASAQLQV
jgi:glutathione synthase/RimK-type ligase-like ATP-grasp enzyme